MAAESRSGARAALRSASRLVWTAFDSARSSNTAAALPPLDSSILIAGTTSQRQRLAEQDIQSDDDAVQVVGEVAQQFAVTRVAEGSQIQSQCLTKELLAKIVTGQLHQSFDQ